MEFLIVKNKKLIQIYFLSFLKDLNQTDMNQLKSFFKKKIVFKNLIY